MLCLQPNSMMVHDAGDESLRTVNDEGGRDNLWQEEKQRMCAALQREDVAAAEDYDDDDVSRNACGDRASDRWEIRRHYCCDSAPMKNAENHSLMLLLANREPIFSESRIGSRHRCT